MELRLGEAIALTAIGNAFLRGKAVSDISSRMRRFGNGRCEFKQINADGNEEIVAANPDAWFETLRPGCAGLRLRTTPVARDVALRPSARFVIESVGTAGDMLLWRAEHFRGSAGWQSVYRVGGDDIWDLALPSSLEQAAEKLRVVLVDAASVADEIADHFAEQFRAGAKALRGAPDDDHWLVGELMRSADLDVGALQVVRACSHAWVFGSMGAWNDFIIDDDAVLRDRYHTVTLALGEAIFAAGVAAANTSFRA